MMLRLTTLTLLLSLSLTTTKAYCDSTTPSAPTCPQVLKAADQVIQAQQQQILTRNNALEDYGVMTKKQADDLAEANRKIDAWYRSPYLYLALGLGAGLYLGKK